MLALEQFTTRLESAGIPYCLVGGVASIAYGRPRLTLDADIVIALGTSDLEKLAIAFPSADFYLPPREVLLAEIERESRGHFNILHQHSALRADCYLPGRSPLARWELANRQRLEGPWGVAWFSPPEAIIAHKLIFFREGQSSKHLDDIRGILAAGSITDPAALEAWIDRLGLQAEWNQANQQPPRDA